LLNIGCFFYRLAFTDKELFMQTKLNQVRAAFSTGDYRKALSIAAKFHDLGAHRNAILDAHLAITNPRWMIGLGKDIEQSIAAGVEALRIRYAF
jgi:hypothetical protein